MKKSIIGISIGTGLAVCAYFYSLYLLGPGYFLSGRYVWLSILIYMIGMWWAAKKSPRTESIRQQIAPAFLVFIVANLAYHIFIFWSFTYGHPEWLEVQRQVMVDHFSLHPPTGATPQEVRQKMEAIQNMDLKPTIGNTLYEYAYSLMGGFLLSWAISFVAHRQ